VALTALTERVHSDGAILPGRKCFFADDDPQYTWLATISSDELDWEENKIPPPFVEEGQGGVHIHCSLVSERAPLWMHHLSQVWDDPQAR